MSNTITVSSPAIGRALFMRGDQVWNGSAMETFADANFATYLITPTQIGTAAKLWLYEVPALLPNGDYDFVVFSGAAPVVSDTPDQAGSFYWDTVNVWLPRTSLAAQQVTLTTKDSYGSVVVGAAVWITASADINDVVAGRFLTDEDGEITCQLVPGNYFSWAEKDGTGFTNPQPLTVTA